MQEEFNEIHMYKSSSTYIIIQPLCKRDGVIEYVWCCLFRGLLILFEALAS
jgi:hypothetical protein